MYRHIYDWNIVACDVKQQISQIQIFSFYDPDSNFRSYFEEFENALSQLFYHRFIIVGPGVFILLRQPDLVFRWKSATASFVILGHAYII